MKCFKIIIVKILKNSIGAPSVTLVLRNLYTKRLPLFQQNPEKVEIQTRVQLEVV